MQEKTEKKKKSLLLRRIKSSYQIYLLLLPVLVWLIIYSYVPMYGIVLAWKDFSFSKGILGSPWIGWTNFEHMFQNPFFLRALRNTFIISLTRLIVTFPLPLVLALLINEVRSTGYRRVIQTLTYLPHFISWVIIGGLVKNFLHVDTGALNRLLASLGQPKVAFLNEPDYFITILMIAEIWKGTGWGSIIYLASIMGIDVSMYEAAELDGCNRLQASIYITIPSIMATIAMQLVLAIANIMNAGFDSIYNLYNNMTIPVADTIDTLVYTTILNENNWELSAAIGLFKTSINFVLMWLGNFLTKKMTGYSMYSFSN